MKCTPFRCIILAIVGIWFGMITREIAIHKACAENNYFGTQILKIECTVTPDRKG